MRTRILLCIAFLFLWTACSPTQSWISSPLKQTADDGLIHIEFEPQKNYQLYYDSFLIVVTNNSSKPIQIDWNRSRYLLNGKPYGTFGFEGITKDNINNLPSDTIPPGKSLSKIIFPLNLIAWKPYRSDVQDAPAFSAGPVPEGTSGLALAFLHADQMKRLTLAVSIRAEAKR